MTTPVEYFTLSDGWSHLAWKGKYFTAPDGWEYWVTASLAAVTGSNRRRLKPAAAQAP